MPRRAVAVDNRGVGIMLAKAGFKVGVFAKPLD